MANEPDIKRSKRETLIVATGDTVSAVVSKKVDRCLLCKQFLDSVLYYGGHPNYSNEEYIALTDEKLNIYTGKEETIVDEDVPTFKITHFSVYDKKGHLCSFDNGLIDSGVHLYFSGYIKPIFDEDSSPENGIPAHDLGPIDEWWMSGYDGGELLPIGFTTAVAHYYLMNAAPEYEPIFSKIKEKNKLAKLVVEFLLENAYENPKYEDIIEYIESTGEYQNGADILVQNAQFICDQVVSLDQEAAEDERPLYTLPCIRTLIKMAGVSFKRGCIKDNKRKFIKISKEKKTDIMSKAITTKLVKDVFEHFFLNEIDVKGESKGPKKKRCGVCEACQNPDCGECNHCLDMRKFGGSGKSKQACKNRRCMYMAIADAEMSDNEEETEEKDNKKKPIVKHVLKKIIHSVKWKEEATIKYKGNQCYLSADIGDFSVEIGDYVMLRSEDEKGPLCIARIIYMYDRFPQKKLFHGHLFCRGTDSILGETANPRELFVVDECDELLLGSVIRKAKVEFKEISENWYDLGGKLNLEEPLEDDGETFFFTKRLENNRFIDLDFNPKKTIEGCNSCRRKALQDEFITPIIRDDCVRWRDEHYTVGTGVFLHPDVYGFDDSNEVISNNEVNKVNEVMYPEYYRKTDKIKGSNKDTPKPFTIGIIEEIIETKQNEIKIKVKIFFRPENAHTSLSSTYTKDVNYLYYSEEVRTVSFNSVKGKCYLTYAYNEEDSSDWCEKGPYRFYFSEAYNPRTGQFVDIPTSAKNIGIIGKGKGNGKVGGKGKQKLSEIQPDWEVIHEPLQCMDVFAGCGGLSEGLKQSRIIKSKWAIEKEVPAANAFRLNNPNCKVFVDNCNDLLDYILNNQATEKGLPEKGEVEMLVGGPPCQGFSGMNRFNSRSYSSFKNSLVVTYLSYCEYYRPKYFILENVRNFVSFKKSMVLKLTLRCLLAIGYQVTFGILQAGQYGIPQTRRRLIILAAAPGFVLPCYPEPLNVFCKKGRQLSFMVDGSSYYNECFWTESAPYRTVTVRDALSDLPNIRNGSMKLEMPYDCEPKTHFQRKVRGKVSSNIVRDHICKEMSNLVEIRMSQIPTYPGADWRDLPNISLMLSDGSYTNLLKYIYRSKKQKPGEKPRGVCKCVLEDGTCDPADKQVNTIIPWCLPHTGDRHNNWAGLYGRLEWSGYFSTTITNPEPMGKQGRVLHPEQHRVVGVRECARSQGFPDDFRFCGNILDKYRQVGNAVPPPLGLAIGRQFAKALNQTKKKCNSF